MLDRIVGVEAFDMPDHLCQGAEAELRHIFAQFFCDKHHEVNYMLGLALELLAKLRILSCDAHRTGIQMTDTHHDAAGGDECCAGKSKLLGAQQGSNRHVATGLELAIGLNGDSAPDRKSVV